VACRPAAHGTAFDVEATRQKASGPVLIIFSFYPTNATLRDSFLQQMLTILSAEDINKDWATISPSTIGPHCIGDIILKMVRSQILF
jgi:hypothetical protein